MELKLFLAQIRPKNLCKYEMDQAEEVLLKTIVTIQPIASHVKFVGLSFSSAPFIAHAKQLNEKAIVGPGGNFFYFLRVIQNTAPLNDKVRPPVWAKIYPIGKVLRPAGKICVA